MTTQATANYTLTATDETARAFNSVENRLKGVQEETAKIGKAASLGFKLFVGGELLEGLRKLGAAMFDVKNATNTIDAGRLQRMREATDQAGKAFAGVAATLGSVLAPMIQHLSEWFVKAVGDGEGLRRFFHALMVGMVRGVGLFADAWRGMEAVWAGLKVVFAGFNAFIFDGMEKADRGVTDLLNKIPGVSVEYSSMWAGMAKDARNRLDETRRDFDDIMSRPIPSEAFASAIADMDKETGAFREQAKTHVAIKKEEAAEVAKVTEEEYDASAIIIEDYQNEIDRQANARRQQIRSAEYKGLKDSLSNLSTLMNSHSRKAFELGKASAIVNTIINTREAAMGAFKALAWIPGVGPALGAAAAATAIAAGAMNVQQIKSQSFNGGGSLSGSSISSSISAGSPSQPSAISEAPSLPLASNASAPSRNVTVMVQSDAGVVSTSWIRDHLIPGINEAVGDGVKIMVA